MRKAIDLSDGPAEIELANETGTAAARYRITDLISELGGKCLCYKAEKLISATEKKLVILKEFYPREHEDLFCRQEDGLLYFHPGNDSLDRAFSEYLQSIRRIQEYAVSEKYEKIRNYLCVDEDVEPLFAGNQDGSVKGTVYYENLYCDGFYWINIVDAAKNRDVVLSQVLRTSVSVMEFLRLFHEVEPKTAYVDIKPEDILIRPDEMGGINYGNVVFFDFDSNRLFGTYAYEEVKRCLTPDYQPVYFRGQETVEIGTASENCTFARVVRKMIDTRDRNINLKMPDGETEVGEALNRILKNSSRDSGIAVKTEGEIQMELDAVRKCLEDDEKNNANQKMMPVFHAVWTVSCVLLAAFYAGLFVLSGRILFFGGGSAGSRVAIAVLAVMIAAATCLILYCAQRYSHILVSTNYYEAEDSKGWKIRNEDYNTFRKGRSRKNTTFKDRSNMHMNQQRARRVWWTLLSLTAAGAFLGLAFFWGNLPFLFMAVFFVIAVFTWWDYRAARKEELKKFMDFSRESHTNLFYERYRSALEKETLQDARVQRAVFFGEEYLETGFDPENSWYYNDGQCKDLSRLRMWIAGKGYREPEKFLRGMPDRHYYDKRIAYAKDGQICENGERVNVELDLNPLHMKHIYKMAFDRLKNNQLICWIAMGFSLLFCALFPILYGNERGMAFTCLPEAEYAYISFGLLLVTGTIHIYEALYSKSYERLVSETAYKSRFVKTYTMDPFTLNELLQRDIVAGYINALDIGRGTTRYLSYVISPVEGESEREKKNKLREFEDYKARKYNFPLFHYRLLTNTQRTDTVILFLFVIVFSKFVWMDARLSLLLPLLAGFVCFRFFVVKVLLEYCGRKGVENTIGYYMKK